MVWLPTAEQLDIIAWECTMPTGQTNEERFCLSTAENTSSYFLLPLSISHVWSPGFIWPCSRQVNSRKKSKGRCLHSLPWHTFAPTPLAISWLHSSNTSKCIWVKNTEDNENVDLPHYSERVLLIFMICVPCSLGSYWNYITEFVFSMVTIWLILPLSFPSSIRMERKEKQQLTIPVTTQNKDSLKEENRYVTRF